MHYRITLLTDKLVRFEYNAQNKFDDRPTQIVMNRDFPAVSYTVEHTADGLVVRTDRLRIVYDEKPFSPNGLSVALVGYENAHTGNWYYGDTVHDLKGTVRTLDAVDGDNVELGHGLISTEGYAVLDDSTSLVLQDDGWVESAEAEKISISLAMAGIIWKPFKTFIICPVMLPCCRAMRWVTGGAAFILTPKKPISA